MEEKVLIIARVVESIFNEKLNIGKSYSIQKNVIRDNKVKFEVNVESENIKINAQVKFDAKTNTVDIKMESQFTIVNSYIKGADTMKEITEKIEKMVELVSGEVDSIYFKKASISISKSMNGHILTLLDYKTNIVYTTLM